MSKTEKRIAVIGHVEHVTLGRSDAPPQQGDVIHLREPRFLPGGGGAIAFAQLCQSDPQDVELHFFTAIGNDAAGEAIRARFRSLRAGVHVHVAPRDEPHPRVVVVVDNQGKRTIIVTGAPLQATAADSLPWEILPTCDAVYFTGSDPKALSLARAAKTLVVTARRAPVLRSASIAPDIILGSVNDPRENAAFATYQPAPAALVLTDGGGPIKIVRADRSSEAIPDPVAHVLGDYGAGDSFAGALTYFLAHGHSAERACGLAAPYGAAVLAGVDPLLTQKRFVRP